MQGEVEFTDSKILFTVDNYTGSLLLRKTNLVLNKVPKLRPVQTSKLSIKYKKESLSFLNELAGSTVDILMWTTGT